jgi:hypothetical protein
MSSLRVAPSLRGHSEAELARLIREGLAYLDGDVIVPFLSGGVAPPLSNNFEGGVIGNTIATTDTGSGDAWNTVTIGASSTCTYDNAHARGLAAMKIVQPATAVATFVNWTGLGAITTSVWGRVYCYLTALPANTVGPCAIRSSANASSGHVLLNTSGNVVAENAAFSVVSTGTKVVPLNEFFRIEWRIISSTTVGEIEWKLFSSVSPGDGADGVTPTETINTTGLVLAANTGRTDFGTPFAGNANQTQWFDDIAVSSTDWLGPSAAVGGAGPQIRPLNPRLRFYMQPGSPSLGFSGLSANPDVVTADLPTHPIVVDTAVDRAANY